MAKENIKKVFTNSIKNVQNGKQPNVQGEMIKAGYSKSSARAVNVKRTKTWQKLLNKVDDQEILDTFLEVMRDKQDKRSRITAAQELAKLKDKYPDKKNKITILDERDELVK